MSDFTWLRHAEHGGYFNCPNAAVADMTELGWEPSDAPVEVNPAVVEQLAWRQELARQQAEQTKPTKPATRGKSSEEMSDG